MVKKVERSESLILPCGLDVYFRPHFYSWHQMRKLIPQLEPIPLILDDFDGSSIDLSGEGDQVVGLKNSLDLVCVELHLSLVFNKIIIS